jgi:hypothetical protein
VLSIPGKDLGCQIKQGANIGGGAVTTFEVKIPPFSTLKIHRSLEIGFEKKFFGCKHQKVEP